MSQELNEQQIVRRNKMKALREKGIDPFGVEFKPRHILKIYLRNMTNIPRKNWPIWM